MSDPTIPCAAAVRVVDRIKAEHVLLARIIAAMQAWVVGSREAGARADYPLFEAMLRYVQEVPDRVHHPQEDQHLFPALAAVPTWMVVRPVRRSREEIEMRALVVEPESFLVTMDNQLEAGEEAHALRWAEELASALSATQPCTPR